MKIILSYCENNDIGCSNIMSNAAKNFYSLTISLNDLYLF